MVHLWPFLTTFEYGRPLAKIGADFETIWASISQFEDFYNPKTEKNSQNPMFLT